MNASMNVIDSNPETWNAIGGQDQASCLVPKLGYTAESKEIIWG